MPRRPRKPSVVHVRAGAHQSFPVPKPLPTDEDLILLLQGWFISGQPLPLPEQNVVNLRLLELLIDRQSNGPVDAAVEMVDLLIDLGWSELQACEEAANRFHLSITPQAVKKKRQRQNGDVSS